MIDQAIFDRLRIQQEKLMQLADRSDLIEVEVVDPTPGWPAEKYIITYRCKGIARINHDREPEYSWLHRMEMYLSDDYPVTEPYLKFLTPIWHPNIASTEPRQVCTDHTKSWWVGKDLDELVEKIGEMVQYKSYHAEWVAPFPKDLEAAQWVLDYAEPRGIVGKEKPLDESPLRSGYEIYQGDQPPPESQVVAEPPRVQANKITLGSAAGENAAIEAQSKRIELGIPRE